ncbi:MAG: polysaccharide biosynthesis protein [Gemmatimonadetes bacterium]|nr:polysaccharide biosynthesis protein [Gemmatimonadota bacterium]
MPIARRYLVALGWMSRLLAMVVSFAMIRIALQLLGESQFAVFQILSAALVWLSLSSMGLGPALKNLISECRARGEPDAALRQAAGVLIALLFLIGGIVLTLTTPAASSFLLRKLNHDQVWATRALLAGGLLSLVSALGQISLEVLYAEFRAWWVYILSIGGSVTTLVFMTKLGHTGRGPAELVFWVVCASLGPQALVGIAALWMTGLLKLRVGALDSGAVKRISRLAPRFWLFALLSNLILVVDFLVISQILVAREIVLYSIMMKMAGVGIVLFTTVISVVWPEWTRDWELQDWTALRKRVWGLATIGTAVCVPGALVAVFAVPLVMRVWLHDSNLVPSALLILEFVAYVGIRFWTDVHSSALMAGNRVTAATTFAVCQALITAPLEYVMGRQWGAAGVILGLIVGFLASAAWMFPRRFYGELDRLAHAPTPGPLGDVRGVH